MDIEFGDLDSALLRRRLDASCASSAAIMEGVEVVEVLARLEDVAVRLKHSNNGVSAADYALKLRFCAVGGECSRSSLELSLCTSLHRALHGPSDEEKRLFGCA